MNTIYYNPRMSYSAYLHQFIIGVDIRLTRDKADIELFTVFLHPTITKLVHV